MPQIPFIQWLKNNKLSYRTINEYERYHKIFSDNPNELISQELVNKFLERTNNHISRAFLKNLKDYTMQNYQDELISEELNKIYRINFGKKNIKDKPKREKKVISIDEVYELEKVFNKEIIKIMLLINYYCALRVSELFFISLDSFNWNAWEKNPSHKGFVLIRGKGGTIEKVLVPPFLMQRLKDYLKKTFEEKPEIIETINKVHLFNLLNYEFPILTEKTILNEEWYEKRNKYIKSNYHRWNKILSKVGEKVLGYTISTHVLRRSFATYLINNGWDLTGVKEHLRHKDISTTQVYTLIDKEKMAKDYEEVVKIKQNIILHSSSNSI